MARVLDGKRVRDAIMAESKPRVERLVAAAGRPPGLVVVLVGNDPGSEVYVRNKVKACAELGIYSEKITPPPTITTDELLALIDELNRRPEIDGILVQMPLPKQVDSRRVLMAIDPEKDVDGFHPTNVGNLVANLPAPRACTPAGVMKMLEYFDIPVTGRNAVVVGRSDIVGKPMSMLLLHQSATVTICHSKTKDLPAVCASADILVAAIGRPAMLTAEYIRPGATVIDVGIEPRLRPGGSAADFRTAAGAHGGVRASGQPAGGRRASGRYGRVLGRLHSRAGRRGTDDHCHADGQHH